MTGSTTGHPARARGEPIGRPGAREERNRRFSAALAHELRTPVASFELQLKEALAHAEGDETRAALSGALRAAERLGGIVVDLLFLERLDAGPSTPAERVDLAALLTERLSRGSPRRTRLQVAEALTVPGDPALIARLLAALLDNAERHADDTITVTLARGDGEAVLTVADDGPGIPPGHRDRVFDLFHRPDTARGRGTGGAGLGLTIARAIAVLHHGTLTAAPAEHGARLVCRLPLR
ncbi:sensor histidine kinase [Actinomadura chibensis]|uniref:histidine kinase n=1 Tax=Actinomadura chibensis TaxID=392828 RepID=A0A5D0NHY2_9ACTN|nr:HAMP domain-containing sensor histidine kinase [Actinomadura chibensis]TYB43988.1 HAMP domain-containing histidine kinase [Actinomadura chibensis]